MRFLRSALAALCAALPLAVALASGPGPRRLPPVGFRVLEMVDASRTSAAFPSGRPVQVSLWYPAASSSPPLVFSDYVALAGRETSFAGSPDRAYDAIARFRGFLKTARVTTQDGDLLLSNPMQASRDAPPADGRFPVVLIAQGNDESASDQAFLAELLAGHGYVVAAPPSQSRISPPMKSEQDIPSHAADQAADLAFALRQARSQPMAKPGPYGIVAHSFGARSGLILAMRDPDAAALVSFDGGIGQKTGKGLLDKVPGFDRAKASLPLLHFFPEADPLSAPDLDLIRSLDRSDRWLVRVGEMRHGHFTSYGLAVQELPSLAAATSAGPRTADAWNAVAAATAAFLDRFVRGHPTEGRRWSPPASPLLRFESLPASGPPTPTPRERPEKGK